MSNIDSIESDAQLFLINKDTQSNTLLSVNELVSDQNIRLSDSELTRLAKERANKQQIKIHEPVIKIPDQFNSMTG